MVVNGKQVTRKTFVEIRGHNVKSITIMLLQKVFSILKVSGYKNKSKDNMLAIMGQHKYNVELYGDLYGDAAGGGTTSRKEPQCSFRLLNVLFSDAFSVCLMGLAATRTRQQLHGLVSANAEFWEDVHLAFTDNTNTDIGQLQFEHHVFTKYGIDPSIIVVHSAQKLKGIYTNLKSRLKHAYANYAKSGMHNSDFWNFCDGQIDVLYLHMFVRAKPGMLSVVTAMMPERACLDSDSIEECAEGVHSNGAESSAGGSRTPASLRGHDKARRMIQIMDSTGMRTELAKRKLEEYNDVAAYCQAKKARDDEREKREAAKEHRDRRAFYWKQFKDFGHDIRCLLWEAVTEDNEAILAMITKEVDFLREEMQRVKAILDYNNSAL